MLNNDSTQVGDKSCPLKQLYVKMESFFYFTKIYKRDSTTLFSVG